MRRAGPEEPRGGGSGEAGSAGAGPGEARDGGSGEAAEAGRRGPRAFALLASIALIGATLSPLLRRPADDGFPLSTYPMFAWPRPTKISMSYSLGVTADGGRRYLSPRLVGSIEVLQANAIVSRAIGGGDAAILELCQAIARRVAASPAHRDITAVRLVTGTHDTVELLVRDRLGGELERGRCDVPRGAP